MTNGYVQAPLQSSIPPKERSLPQLAVALSMARTATARMDQDVNNLRIANRKLTKEVTERRRNIIMRCLHSIWVCWDECPRLP